MYKSLVSAFTYQAVVGAISIVAVGLWGAVGTTAIVLLAFRPFLLTRVKEKPGTEVWRLYYRIGKLAVVLTALTMIFVYLSADLVLGQIVTREILLITIIPYFLFIHGVIGIMYTMK